MLRFRTEAVTMAQMMTPNSIVICACTIHCSGITFHKHHIVTDKEPVLISMCIQYMKCSLFILIDVICYCLHTKSVIMKFKNNIYISERLYSKDPEF